MVAIVDETEEIDLDHLSAGIGKALPIYARPLFLRVIKKPLSLTGQLTLLFMSKVVILTSLYFICFQVRLKWRKLICKTMVMISQKLVTILCTSMTVANFYRSTKSCMKKLQMAQKDCNNYIYTIDFLKSLLYNNIGFKGIYSIIKFFFTNLIYII